MNYPKIRGKIWVDFVISPTEAQFFQISRAKIWLDICHWCQHKLLCAILSKNIRQISNKEYHNNLPELRLWLKIFKLIIASIIILRKQRRINVCFKSILLLSGPNIFLGSKLYFMTVCKVVLIDFRASPFFII